MNKRVKAICCALAVTLSLVIAPTTTKIGPFGVDVVAAATGEGEAAPAASAGSSGSSSSYSASGASRILVVGLNGDDVKAVQTALNSNGYKLDVDGWYGPQTAAAVKDYQKQKGLAVDGIVGPNTLAVLIPASVVPKTTVGIGVTGNDVKYLQSNLNKLGYKLDVDGIFGSLTIDAVKKFQKENGLDVDGYAGPKTFGKLFEKVSAPVATVPTPVEPTKPTVPSDVIVDTVTGASIVDNNVAFEKSISKEGSWITAITKNLTFDKALVVDGAFTNGLKENDGLKRKIGLYAQDDKHKVTARYTLTAPKITFNSPSGSLEHGNFKGDVYVAGANFKLINAKIEGNLYFLNAEAQKTFTIQDKTDDEKSVITGEQIMVDTITGASVVDNTTAFEKSISKADGSWITAITKDLTFTKGLLVDGTYTNGEKENDGLRRKIGLYAQDDKHNVTARYTLTAPQMIFNSPSGSIEHGNFVGDLLVSGKNFKLINAKIDGDLYFMNPEAHKTFSTADKATDNATVITGNTVDVTVDTVTGASVVDNNEAFEKSISKDGSWITAITKDLTFAKELVVEGAFTNGEKANDGLRRKIGLYAQDDKHKVTARYTLTAPKVTFNSPYGSIEHGTVKGDVYVSSKYFKLVNAKIDGNLYFLNEEAQKTFSTQDKADDEKSVVTGEQKLIAK